MIEPMTVVIDHGTHRIGVQSWIPSNETSFITEENAFTGDAAIQSPISEFFGRLEWALAEILLNGVDRGDVHLWEELARNAVQLGFVRFTTPIDALRDTFANRPNTLQWERHPPCQLTEELCVRSRLASELMTGHS